jgi:hypothetical protein
VITTAADELLAKFGLSAEIIDLRAATPMCPPGRTAIDHVQRDPRAAARHRHFRAACAWILRRPRESAGQPSARSAAGSALAEIVGATGDERDDGLNRPPTGVVYWPMTGSSIFGSRNV